jgi:hypothetical protein
MLAVYSKRSCDGIDLPKHTLDVTVNGELTSSQSTNHEETSRKTAEAATKTKLLRDLDESAGGALTWETLGLVDLAEHSIGGLRDDSGGETGDQAGAKVDSGVHGVGRSGLVDKVLVDGFGDLFVDNELGHCVWDSVGGVISILCSMRRAVGIPTA